MQSRVWLDNIKLVSSSFELWYTFTFCVPLTRGKNPFASSIRGYNKLFATDSIFRDNFISPLHVSYEKKTFIQFSYLKNQLYWISIVYFYSPMQKGRAKFARICTKTHKIHFDIINIDRCSFEFSIKFSRFVLLSSLIIVLSLIRSLTIRLL